MVFILFLRWVIYITTIDEYYSFPPMFLKVNKTAQLAPDTSITEKAVFLSKNLIYRTRFEGGGDGGITEFFKSMW